VGLALLGLAALLWTADRPGYFTGLRFFFTVIGTPPQPFDDFGSILSAAFCWRQGVNVYLPNACMGGGIFNYSPAMLELGRLPVGPWLQFPGGMALDIGFILSWAWLPPARAWPELGARLAASCSGAVAWELAAANVDEVIFLIVLAALWCLPAHRRLQLAGYALFLLAAALKFYPAALLALMAREPVRVILLAVILCDVAGGLYFSEFRAGTAAAVAVLPGFLPFLDLFGALNLPYGLVLLHNLNNLTLLPAPAAYLAAIHRPMAMFWLHGGKLAGCVAVLIVAMLRAPARGHELRELDEVRLLCLLAGAILITFCFMATQNLNYREIFLLLALPGLAALARRRDDPMLLWGPVLLMWETPIRHLATTLAGAVLAGRYQVDAQVAVWLLRELLWWWFVLQLLEIIISFLRGAAASLWRARGRSA
jgi:hypothetical protein